MHVDMLDGTSFRYMSVSAQDRWRWAAETDLDALLQTDAGDYTSIFGGLGAWWERSFNPAYVCADNGHGQYTSPGCPASFASTGEYDEFFGIYAIQKNSPLYDSDNYHSASINHLVLRAQAGASVGQSYTWIDQGEVLSPASPNPISGTLLIKWRMINSQYSTGPRYQKIAYLVDTTLKRMKIRWGTLRTTAGAANNEVVNPPGRTTVCDPFAPTLRVTCHDRTQNDYVGL
jgi:hypothetical protein